MRTVLLAVIAAIATGAAWWLWGQPDTARPAEEGQALVAVTLPITLSPDAEAGQQVFAANCASCHGTNAEGRAGTAPPLIHKIYEPRVSPYKHQIQNMTMAARMMALRKMSPHLS